MSHLLYSILRKVFAIHSIKTDLRPLDSRNKNSIFSAAEIFEHLFLVIEPGTPHSMLSPLKFLINSHALARIQY